MEIVKQQSCRPNDVGALSEYCVHNRYPEPKYDVIDEQGPAHSKLFTIMCCMSHLSVTGQAATKKEAKQESAKNLLKKLKQLKNDTNTFTNHDSPYHMSNKIQTKNENCETIINKPEETAFNINHVIDIINFLKKIHCSTGTSSVHVDINHYYELLDFSATLHYELLCKIVEQLGIIKTVTEIPARVCDNGLIWKQTNYRAIRLSTRPPIVEIGSSLENAAKGMLETLFIMSTCGLEDEFY